MAKKKSEKLVEEMREKWGEIKGIRDKVVEEKRSFTDEEKEKIEGTLDEVGTIEVQVQKERADEALIGKINDLNELFVPSPSTGSGNGSGNGKGRPSTGSGKGRQLTSLGMEIVNSPVYKAWMKSVAPNGRIPDSMKGISSPPIEVKGLLQKALNGQKTLLTGTSDTSAGAFVNTDFTGIYEPLGRWPLRVRDLIANRTTGSDTVEFVRQTTQVTQAEPVAEANVTDYSGATGEVSGEKPEATTTFAKVQEVVKTIAVWIPATKRALSDAAQLQGIVNQELMDDLNEELEDQILNGDGVGENFTGLANTANVLVQAFDTDVAVTARKAITHLLINGKQMPTAWLLNPQDWETFDLLQDDQGRYYWGGPMAMGPRTLWGIPVAQSFLQASGTGWLANWSKAVLWDRMMATITMTDSHADFFIRNMVAVLAELRAAFGVIRPTAFVEVDLSAGS